MFSDVCRPRTRPARRVAIGGLTPQIHVYDLVAFCHVELVQVIPECERLACAESLRDLTGNVFLV